MEMSLPDNQMQRTRSAQVSVARPSLLIWVFLRPLVRQSGRSG